MLSAPRAKTAAFRIPHSKLRTRAALTLVELLVAIAIVSILATLILGAAAAAGGTAREARSKSMVARLHTLLVERYDSYRTRRVEVVPFQDTPAFRAFLTSATGIFLPADIRPAINGSSDPRVSAMARVAALRELMKLELPDRWSDVLGADVPASPVTIENEPASLQFVEEPPAAWQAYARAYNQLVGRENSVTGATNARDEIVANQGAELLYLVITQTAGDGEARSLFKQADIGDADGDGAPEFFDGYRQPISFLRWAPGFDSDLQIGPRKLTKLAVADARNEVLDDHDPYDLFRIDNPSDADADLQAARNFVGLRGWRLVPLVVSPGRDGRFGLLLDNPTGNLAANVNPYATVDTALWLGSRNPDDADAYADNVHSHSVSTLSRAK